jgi:FAD/FMN-containing dehydrogenase
VGARTAAQTTAVPTPTDGSLAAFLTDVRATVGASHVVADADVLASVATDWTGRFRGAPSAMVSPGSVDDARAIVLAARRHAVALVPVGGNTGLVAGATAMAGEVAVSLRRLTSIGALDERAGQITVGAGVVLEHLAAAIAPQGWEPPVDLGARGSATIGGMVATNAGGLHVVRNGAMRANVAGIEAVLGTGDVVSHLAGLDKDNTGYDLAGLLTGSEGTLGIVTAVRLRLVRTPRAPTHVGVACESWSDAVAFASEVRRCDADVWAIEAVGARAQELVRDQLAVTLPFGEPCAVLVVAVVDGDPSAVPVGERHAVVDRRVWEIRDRTTEAVARVGVPHKLDVTLPLAQLATFAERVGELVAPHDAVLFGHLGDGNVHVNVLGPPDDDESVDEAVFRLVVQLDGSISAEHGIGRAKARWLSLQRSGGEIAAMRAIKGALDPDGVLNPNVLFASLPD